MNDNLPTFCSSTNRIKVSSQDITQVKGIQDMKAKVNHAPVIPGDFHLIITDREDSFNSHLTCYDSSGKVVWTVEALAKGQHSDYTKQYGDTPPGLYRIGELTITQADEPTSVKYSFGFYFFDLVSIEGGEITTGRKGIGIHGGGSNAPQPLAPIQQLCTTNGCIRMHNKDIETYLLPIYKQTQKIGNTIYVSVNQL